MGELRLIFFILVLILDLAWPAVPVPNWKSALDYAESFDGFILGLPVHYVSASGLATAFLDRAFFAAFLGRRGTIFCGKPRASVVSCRIAGSTFTFDQLNKYFTISEIPIISGRYWNMVHGYTHQMKSNKI